MNLFNDTLIFIAVIQEGGFSHAAKSLGVSNGMISRHIAHLEAELGVTLIKRTTRQIKLTQEGELFWEHVQTLKQDMDSAIDMIRSTANKPKGQIKISAPLFIGRNYLTPVIVDFLKQYPDINVDLELSNFLHDPIKDQLDLVVRSSGFVNESRSHVNHLRGKLLLKDPIGLYASSSYLKKNGAPTTVDELRNHIIVSSDASNKAHHFVQWNYTFKNEKKFIKLAPSFNCNDIESSLNACIAGYGVGRFSHLVIHQAMQKHHLVPVLENYDWGAHDLYAVYSNQTKLPQRTRLLMNYIATHLAK